jgi:hypothetical protein
VLHNLFSYLVMRKHLYAMALLTVFLTLPYFAQSAAAGPDDEDTQSWNDLQVGIPLSKQFEFYSKLTLRFGKNITRVNDGRQTFGLTWKPTSSLTISPFYTFIRARNTAGFFRKEDRYSLSAAYKFPIKAVGLTHKSTYESRHRAAGDTWRYRAAVTIDKALPKSFLEDTKLFVTDEVFYDSATSRFSRNRFSIGLTRTISKHLSGDLYYMRQNDGFSHPGDLNVVGFAGRYRL